MLNVVWSVFGDKGYYVVKVGDIVKVVGVVKGIVYFYFDDK